jgi:hypothetical protein
MKPYKDLFAFWHPADPRGIYISENTVIRNTAIGRTKMLSKTGECVKGETWRKIIHYCHQ